MSVVIYTDDVNRGRGVMFANMAYNLIGHFTDAITMRSALDYQAGDLAAFDYALYLGYVDTTLPDDFLADVLDDTAPMFWISGNINQLVAYAGAEALGFGGGEFVPSSNRDRMTYKGRVLRRAGDLAHFNIVPGPQAQTLIEMFSQFDANDRAPYYVRVRRLCYMADNPFPDETLDNRSLVFADYLHEFLNATDHEGRRALVRFEDLAPGVSDENYLDFFSDELAGRDIPFSMGVIPLFKDPAGLQFPKGTEYLLPEDDAFLDALDNMIERGGVVVMHGYTHQHDDGISRIDWEFTQGPGNKPLPYDSAEWARSRVERGLALFHEAGLEPQIWETPHYAASHGDYRVFSEFFDVLYERPLVFPIMPGDPPVFAEFLSPTTQIIPYELLTTSLGVPIIPENLGYIDPGDPYADPQVLLNWASDLTIIRDAVASFYFHHDWVDPADLDTVLDGLSDLGYTFVGVDELDLFTPPGDSDDDDDETGDDDSADSGGCGC